MAAIVAILTQDELRTLIHLAQERLNEQNPSQEQETQDSTLEGSAEKTQESDAENSN
jgi:hypothetical protein